jgi:hypothetical protein
MTVRELKKELTDRDIQSNGLKAALVARLKEAIESGEAAETVEAEAAPEAAPEVAPEAAPEVEATPADAEAESDTKEVTAEIGEKRPREDTAEPEQEAKKTSRHAPYG